RGMIVLPDIVLEYHRKEIIALAAQHRTPDLYGTGGQSGWDGLIYYSSDWVDLYRRAALYVDLVLRGAKPEELPVQEPTRFRLIINLKTAKSLGITVPPTLLARADEVIE